MHIEFLPLPKDGKCPVPENELVVLKFARGNTEIRRAGDVDWRGFKGCYCTSTHLIGWGRL
jgi:hypothetical protein